MIDIKIHPLVGQAYAICVAIEKCKSSPEINKASSKAADLLHALHDYFKELENVPNNN